MFIKVKLIIIHFYQHLRLLKNFKQFKLKLVLIYLVFQSRYNYYNILKNIEKHEERLADSEVIIPNINSSF